ncbi:pyrophosphatase DCP2 [Russula earlei]|uniref:Pyrophosphatase DCP2 n=1 Tax=Russula earlei TaxID=71964 RepID=A0ACC0ULN5_9AGAM|nr:pyrophosphatase DCP2 [Russula earlei]
MASSSSSSPELSPNLHTHPPNPYKYSTIDEVLDDLSSRFILNLPDNELASLERICFQVEQAHWYYEDFIREENPKFPSLPLKKFSEMFFQACPLLERWRGDHDGAFDHFMRYKTRVPVCGAIMLNDTWDKVVLVKGWKSSSGWGFPKGKINQNEPSHECAAREVAEETGYNLNGKINLENVIEMEIREQQISLFVVPGIPEDFPFETKTRKEISKIEWFRLVDLPTWKRNKAAPGRFYLISPFIGPLKAFINEHKPRKPPRRTQRTKDVRHKQEFPDESDTSAMECPTTHLDTTAQESSSQTSSADNGDPQTPSPLYSEAVATRFDVAQTTQTNGLDSKAVDSHFARLLSGLTLSANANATGDGNLDGVPPAGAGLHPPSVLPAAVGDAPTSHGVPQTRNVLTSGAALIGESAAVAHSHTTSKPAKRSSMSVLSNDPSRLNTSSPASHVSSPHLPSQSTITPAVVTSRPSGAKSPTHSGRSSMVSADLSPYLARPAGIPMNGKRLRQLALLEAVADESSRMTLAPPMRPVTQPPSPPHEASSTAIHTPLTPDTVMSHNLTNLSPMYSNTHGPYLPSVPQTGSFNPSSLDNAFTVRPRTSNSFRPVPNHPPRPFNTRGSMNQAQLLGALSGTSYPSTPGLQRPPIPPMSYNNSPSFPSTSPVVAGAPIFRTGPHPPVVGRGPPPPLHVLPSQATFGTAAAQGLPSPPGVSSSFRFPHSITNPQNSQLLSILNGGPSQ